MRRIIPGIGTAGEWALVRAADAVGTWREARTARRAEAAEAKAKVEAAKEWAAMTQEEREAWEVVYDRRQRLGPHDRDTLVAMLQLASVLSRYGKDDAAIQLTKDVRIWAPRVGVTFNEVMQVAEGWEGEPGQEWPGRPPLFGGVSGGRKSKKQRKFKKSKKFKKSRKSRKQKKSRKPKKQRKQRQIKKR